jgi:hypothetical protein
MAPAPIPAGFDDILLAYDPGQITDSEYEASASATTSG